MASKRQRVSYTAEFKLNVISKAEEVGNREAGRMFCVDESNVRLWRKNKNNLSQCLKKRRANRYGLPHWPTLEDNLHNWILGQRDAVIPISTTKIRLKAKVLANEMHINNFSAGPSWCHRFMQRKNLRIRSRTTIGQKLPDDWQEKEKNFLDYVKLKISEKNYSPNQIINMDEVPLCFDCPPNRTVESVGVRSVPVVTTGNEKNSFTVILSCSASGEKLDPMVVFKRKTMMKEEFPKGIKVAVNPNGWMNQEILNEWLSDIWRKRKGAFFKPSGMLIMDSMKTHISDETKRACKSVSANLCIIPGGLTKKLQPLDVGVNKSFKSKVRRLWEKWMSEGIHTYTKKGTMRKASYSEVCRWIKQAWDEVSPDTIKNSFRKSGIINGELSSENELESGDDSTNS